MLASEWELAWEFESVLGFELVWEWEIHTLRVFERFLSHSMFHRFPT